jgi:hypothetical protein
MMKTTVLFLFSLLVVFHGKAQSRNYTVGFYNVENLYDTLNDPQVDDEEFLPGGKNQWTGDRYERKLNNLARVIDSLGGGPSVLGLCEVENRLVLEDLCSKKRLKEKGYGILHHNSPDRRGIDVAMLYKKADFEPLYTQFIRVALADDPEFITRDIFLVHGQLGKEEIYLFVNHWPSRRGGEDVSKPKRMAAAKALRHSIDTILAKKPKAAIVVMGDLNDEPTDASLVEGLKASGNPKSGDLFNTMYALKEKGDGSHSYKEQWGMLDQLIVSSSLLNPKTGLHWQVGSSQVYRPVWMHDKYSKHQGAPYRTYVGPKFIGGYSDHFPVYMVLTGK